MQPKSVSKKKYLKILNKRLHAEQEAPFEAMFVFYPPGSAAKHATGLTASEPSSQSVLALMAKIQSQAATEFVIVKGPRVGNGKRRD